MEPIKCFMIEEHGQVERYLRRYHFSCTAKYRWLNGMTYLDTISVEPNTCLGIQDVSIPISDPRWPVECDCGYKYTEADPRQVFTERVYHRPDTGALMTLRTVPAGAMWNAWWYTEFWKGADGMSIVVKCPGGSDWCIDFRANNCTLPGDWEHKCWVRHGVPPNLTVDKNGRTCAAGAGSIQTSNWHGFLRDGFLVE